MWFDARAYCMLQGADLASIHNDDEKNFIYDKVSHNNFHLQEVKLKPFNGNVKVFSWWMSPFKKHFNLSLVIKPVDLDAYCYSKVYVFFLFLMPYSTFQTNGHEYDGDMWIGLNDLDNRDNVWT